MQDYFLGTYRCDDVLNPDGSQKKRHWLWWHVPIFEFTNDPVAPLTFYAKDDDEEFPTCYQPDRHYITDGGSTPPPTWGFGFIQLSPFAFRRPYLFHDGAFQYGGLYIKRPHETEFHFRLMTMGKVNALLGRMLKADRATPLDIGAISLGLAIGSPFTWHPDRQAQARKEAGIVT